MYADGEDEFCGIYFVDFVRRKDKVKERITNIKEIR